MHRRKIQLVGGSSYTISLPKEWVIKNKLKEKDEVTIHEKSDKTLVIGEEKVDKLKEIEFNVDEYSNIKQVIFGAYYIGIEKIILKSKKEISKKDKINVRKAIRYMSGTEIVYEDNKKIIVAVLLDKAKVDVKQTMYRISLIIEDSAHNIIDGLNLKEMIVNEQEIDRLYQLLTKMISLALINSNVLSSSNIKNTIKIPSYFLISKKLENIGDTLYYLSKYLNKKKIRKIDFGKVLQELVDELKKATRFIISKNIKMYESKHQEDFKKEIDKIKDVTIYNHLHDIRRYVKDVSEEIANLSFYRELISKGNL